MHVMSCKQGHVHVVHDNDPLYHSMEGHVILLFHPGPGRKARPVSTMPVEDRVGGNFVSLDSEAWQSHIAKINPQLHIANIYQGHAACQDASNTMLVIAHLHLSVIESEVSCD